MSPQELELISVNSEIPGIVSGVLFAILGGISLLLFLILRKRRNESKNKYILLQGPQTVIKNSDVDDLKLNELYKVIIIFIIYLFIINLLNYLDVNKSK